GALLRGSLERVMGGSDVDATQMRLELAQVDDRRRVAVHVGRQLRESLVELALLSLPSRFEHARAIPTAQRASNVCSAPATSSATISAADCRARTAPTDWPAYSARASTTPS